MCFFTSFQWVGARLWNSSVGLLCMGLSDTPYFHRALWATVLTGFYRHCSTNCLTASPGGIKDSDISLLLGKVRHRKFMVTVALRRHDSGDNSTFLMPGSRSDMADTLYGKEDLSFSSGPLSPFFCHAWCWLDAHFVAASPFQRCCSAAMWVGTPQFAQRDAITRVFMLGHRPQCLASMSWVTALTSLGLCRAHSATTHTAICSPISVAHVDLSVSWFCTTISPMVLTVDCGKDKALGMGDSFNHKGVGRTNVWMDLLQGKLPMYSFSTEEPPSPHPHQRI